jgi:hypothetical protein
MPEYYTLTIISDDGPRIWGRVSLTQAEKAYLLPWQGHLIENLGPGAVAVYTRDWGSLAAAWGNPTFFLKS